MHSRKSPLCLLFAFMATLVSRAEADVVILDQIGSPPSITGSFAAQVFEPSYASFDRSALDDFQVTASALLLTKVEAVFTGSAADTFARILSYDVAVFSNPAAAQSTLIGDVANLTIAPGNAGLTSLSLGYSSAALISIPVTIALPSAGTYWIAITPRMNFVQSVGDPQQVFVGINNSPNSGGLNVWFANPGNGFGDGTLYSSPYNASYRITAVPEPASILLIGLGLLSLTVARRWGMDGLASR